METNILKYNTYNLEVGAKYSICPICSNQRKKQKQKCMMLDWQTGIGTCQHCGAIIQLHEKETNNNFRKNEITRHSKQLLSVKPQATSYISKEIFKKSFSHYSDNQLIQYLTSLFGKTKTDELIRKYRIGTSKHWQGASVFWQIDHQLQIRTGKIMLYNAQTGKRIKQPFNHINWVHNVLKLKDYNLKQCLFGEHLLNDIQPAALVESEKTAIIADAYLPRFTWLAVGSLNNLTVEKCKILNHRTVVLYPDLNAYKQWTDKAKQIEQKLNIKFIISEILLNKATQTQISAGYDLADYLVLYDWFSLQANISEQSKLDKLMQINTNIQLLIDAFDLEIR